MFRSHYSRWYLLFAREIHHAILIILYIASFFKIPRKHFWRQDLSYILINTVTTLFSIVSVARIGTKYRTFFWIHLKIISNFHCKKHNFLHKKIWFWNARVEFWKIVRHTYTMILEENRFMVHRAWLQDNTSLLWWLKKTKRSIFGRYQSSSKPTCYI